MEDIYSNYSASPFRRNSNNIFLPLTIILSMVHFEKQYQFPILLHLMLYFTKPIQSVGNP